MDGKARIVFFDYVARVEGDTACGRIALGMARELREREGLGSFVEHARPPKTRRRRVGNRRKKLYLAAAFVWMARWALGMRGERVPRVPRPYRRYTKLFHGVATALGMSAEGYDMALALQSGKREFMKVYWRNLQAKQIRIGPGRHELVPFAEMADRFLLGYQVEFSKMSLRPAHEMRGGVLAARGLGSSVPEHEKTMLAFRSDVNALLGAKCGELAGVRIPEREFAPADPGTEGEIPSGQWWEWREVGR
jgi:hypothetical protein